MNFWNDLSIFHKLFITLFGGIVIVVVMLLSYLWGHESELILKKENDLLHLQSQSVARELNLHLIHLAKELAFLSQLEVMDDMVVRDMDRRITIIMKQKADDIGEEIFILGISPDFKVYASSISGSIEKNVPFASLLLSSKKDGKSFFFTERYLYLFTPIYTSFNQNKFLGYVVMAYPTINLQNRLAKDPSIHRWLVAPDTYKGKSPTRYLNVDQTRYLHGSISLEGVLEGWTLHYAKSKKEALAMLYHFQTLFLGAFATGLILIAGIVWMILLRIIRPLRELSQTARYIAATGDYTQTVLERGKDEVGVMAHSFNTLMYATRLSMERIEIMGKREAALVSKSSFLSSMSHELRTPLGSILSLTQYLMTRHETPDSMHETLGKIENSAHHLLGVINNVLDLAKAEAGKIVCRPNQCDLVKMIDDTIELVTPLAEEKDLTITTSFNTCNESFRTDTKLFAQVLVNLLSNSIKYTDTGSIDIRLDYDVDNGNYTLTVKDTGCGIASESLEYLFDEFYRADTSIAESIRGSGLGLAISQKIAHLLGGRILVESDGIGEGTTALFRFQSMK